MRLLITLLAGWFSDLGFNVEFQPVRERETNLICSPAPDMARAVCCLTGHTDTVPFDDGRWTRPVHADRARQ